MKWVFTRGGVTKPLNEWCIEYGKDYSAACKQARKGYSIDQILEPRHGATRGGKITKAYRIWCSMHRRCNNAKDRWYGGAGVKVCKRWSNFKNFLADMGEPLSEIHQIDRKKNSVGYTPSNCRWVTPSENALNRKTTRWLVHNGQRKSLSQWAKELGLSVQTLKNRIDCSGWPLSKALTSEKFR